MLGRHRGTGRRSWTARRSRTPARGASYGAVGGRQRSQVLAGPISSCAGEIALRVARGTVGSGRPPVGVTGARRGRGSQDRDACRSGGPPGPGGPGGSDGPGGGVDAGWCRHRALGRPTGGDGHARPDVGDRHVDTEFGRGASHHGVHGDGQGPDRAGPRPPDLRGRCGHGRHRGDAGLRRARRLHGAQPDHRRHLYVHGDGDERRRDESAERTQPSRDPDRVHRPPPGLLARGLRRRHLQLRRGHVPRLHREPGTRAPGGGHGPDGGPRGLLGSRLRRGRLRLR